MGTAVLIVIVVAVVCGIIGYLSDGSEGAVNGAVGGGMGCAYVLFQIFIWGLGILFVVWLFNLIFG